MEDRARKKLKSITQLKTINGWTHRKSRKSEEKMKIYREESLTNFEFWSGAKTNAVQLTIEEMEQVDEMLQELCPDGMDETSINDLFWFEFETVCEWLGLELDENEDIIRA